MWPRAATGFRTLPARPLFRHHRSTTSVHPPSPAARQCFRNALSSVTSPAPKSQYLHFSFRLPSDKKRGCEEVPVSRATPTAHGGGCGASSVIKTARLAHERGCGVLLVSRIASTAHERVYGASSVSKAARLAHERECEGLPISRASSTAHERVCGASAVSKAALLAHERGCEGLLVSRASSTAHERGSRAHR